MTTQTLSKGLFESAKSYLESDRKKYEVKTSIIFDKEEPLNVSKMYLVVMLRDPYAMIRDENGKWIKDKKWRFAYKTKKGCFAIRDFTHFRMIKWYKGETYKQSTIFWKENQKESQRLRAFASNFKVCQSIMNSVSDCFKPATARYFETKKRLNATDEVTQ